MSQEHIHRVTLFKIPEVEDQNKLLAKYKVAQQKALKNGDPYIIRVEAGQTEDNQRNQGYTVCAKTTFASMDDFEYYDKTCEAHKEIRAFAASVNKGSMMVFFKGAINLIDARICVLESMYTGLRGDLFIWHYKIVHSMDSVKYSSKQPILSFVRPPISIGLKKHLDERDKRTA